MGDILSFVDVGLVFGFIMFIEVIKSAIKTLWGKDVKADVWKIVAWVGGYLLAIVAMGINEQLTDFNIWVYIKQGFLYSAGSTIVYQTGKLGLKNLVKKYGEK